MVEQDNGAFPWPCPMHPLTPCWPPLSHRSPSPQSLPEGAQPDAAGVPLAGTEVAIGNALVRTHVPPVLAALIRHTGINRRVEKYTQRVCTCDAVLAALARHTGINEVGKEYTERVFIRDSVLAALARHTGINRVGKEYTERVFIRDSVLAALTLDVHAAITPTTAYSKHK